MAGPAIRNVELARQLAQAGHQVSLAVPVSTDLDGLPFRVLPYDPAIPASLANPVAEADVVVLQGWVLERHPFLRDSAARLVVDLYDPFPLEHLASVKADRGRVQFPPWDEVLGTLVNQVRLGDFFLCASERQRDFWLGMLLALNRINPATYERDAGLRSLVDVVPFGTSADPPRRSVPSLRGVIPGIGGDDFVLLWAGGVYNWFDPLTLIKAVADVAIQHQNLRLVFLASSHPNPEVPPMDMLARARVLSEELGLTGKHVFFNQEWVPYDRRADWLLDADVGISTHPEHVETRLSFRTRILDYLWAGLPIICTAGDSLGDVIERERAGVTVPAEDADSLARAIAAMVSEPGQRSEMGRNAGTLGRTMTWDAAAIPLLRYCREAEPAADRQRSTTNCAVVGLVPETMPPANHDSGFTHLTRRGLAILVDGGPIALAHAVKRRLRRSIWAR